MHHMILVTGFVSWGILWLRNCNAFHPEIAKIPVEMVLFREHGFNTQAIEDELEAVYGSITSMRSTLQTKHRPTPHLLEMGCP